MKIVLSHSWLLRRRVKDDNCNLRSGIITSAFFTTSPEVQSTSGREQATTISVDLRTVLLNGWSTTKIFDWLYAVAESLSGAVALYYVYTVQCRSTFGRQDSALRTDSEVCWSFDESRTPRLSILSVHGD